MVSSVVTHVPPSFPDPTPLRQDGAPVCSSPALLPLPPAPAPALAPVPTGAAVPAPVPALAPVPVLESVVVPIPVPVAIPTPILNFTPNGGFTPDPNLSSNLVPTNGLALGMSPPAPNPTNPAPHPHVNSLAEELPDGLHTISDDSSKPIGPGEPVGPTPSNTGLQPEVNNDESKTVSSLPVVFTPKPLRRQYIGDWRGLPLKQQVAGYASDVERMWEQHEAMWEQLQTVQAHARLLQHENEALRRQLQARAAPKHTCQEASAASKVQKHGFLTNPEAEGGFREALAEEGAKKAAEQQKAAEKAAREREIEGNQTKIMTDSTYQFKGTIQSYKTTSLRQLGDLAASLALPFTRLKRAEMYEKIVQRFETHPDLKSLPRYTNLF
ncbi:hypothetical protein FRC06_008149 [Ceratobasidium sp. 370]|nr:hypothetical protein FRC06_008149 [Ceratobasidium sp. 370]